MKTLRKMVALVATSLLILPVIAQNEQNTKCNFTVGEKLEYVAWFQLGAIKVDRVTISSVVEADTYKGDPVYKISATAKTEKSMKTFYALKDTFICRMNQSDLMTRTFYQHDVEKKYNAIKEQTYEPLAEGGYKITASENINGKKKSITYRYKKDCPIDALSILYKTRNIDYDNLKKSDKVSYTNFEYDKNTDMVLTYMGKEEVQLRDKSKHTCHKFQFFTGDGTVFTSEYPVYVWIETGSKHRVVHAEAKLKIGYAKVDLANL